MADKSKANLAIGAIVALVVLAAVAALLVMHSNSTDAGDLIAIVHDCDGKTYDLALSTDQTVAVTTRLGTNVVVVEKGDIYVREADCANRDCVHQGKISAPGQQIICLPHKLWIEVVSSGEKSGVMDVDAVTGGKEGLDAVAR